MNNALLLTGKLKDHKIIVEYYLYERKTGDFNSKPKKKEIQKKENLVQNFEKQSK